MKTKLIAPQTVEAKEIDWSIPRLYINPHTESIIYSTGKHDIETFSGMCIHGDSGLSYSDTWVKAKFTPITEPITIQFNCDEE